MSEPQSEAQNTVTMDAGDYLRFKAMQADAALGAALREALATARGRVMKITPIGFPTPRDYEVRFVNVGLTEEGNRLATLLTRPAAEQTEEARAMVEAVDRNAERRRQQAERE